MGKKIFNRLSFVKGVCFYEFVAFYLFFFMVYVSREKGFEKPTWIVV